MPLLRLTRVTYARLPSFVPLAVMIAAVLAAIAATAAQKADIGQLEPQDIEIRAMPYTLDPANPGRRDFGRLQWRGGLELRSANTAFGGYSGLSISRNGEDVLAISDSGSWLSARLEQQDGRLTGLTDARIGPITQKDGQPIQQEWRRDAEALTAVDPAKRDGRYLIAFEGEHRIDEYQFSKGVLRGPLGSVKLPPELKGMGSNRGLEGVTFLRGGPHAGAIVAFAERKLDKAGGHTGALIRGSKSYPLSLTRDAAFDITALESMADGSLLILERSFIRASMKLDIRLRLVPAQEIKSQARLRGKVIFQADQSLIIDNFEAMAVSEGDKGETIITLMSDDNFNFFQKTLIAQFALAKE